VGVEDGALLERRPGVTVVAEDRPGGTDAVQLGDAVTVQLPAAQERFLIVRPLEAPLDSIRILASSPLARSVLGRRAGDLVDVTSPRAGIGRGSWPWNGPGCRSDRR
jgi:transcription elongation GreA/GreB family factor